VYRSVRRTGPGRVTIAAGLGESLTRSHHARPIDGLIEFIGASPSPFHATATVRDRLVERGFAEVPIAARRAAPLPRRGVVRIGGALVAWIAPAGGATESWRVIAAHTDSPNLRVKPRPDLAAAGCRQVAVEPYGGVLLTTWLDRDLGLSGRVVVRSSLGNQEERLVAVSDPVLRIPNLAIHLDSGVNERGLVVDRQRHLHPIWGLGAPAEGLFERWIAELAGVGPTEVLSWDLMCHDVVGPTLWGRSSEFLASARLDNLCSSFGAVEALVALDGAELRHGVAIALFDHEEVGSESATGAGSPLLADALDLLGADWHVSALLSADMAHALHPNHVERHEPSHPALLGGGPVIKVNVNQRYATDAWSAADFRLACEEASVPVQVYAHRADLACGSTIGPIASARLGVATVDVGIPQLAMHSIRESLAVSDVDAMVAAFTAWARRPVPRA
jgi:aspartyl aminopeptidase